MKVALAQWRELVRFEFVYQLKRKSIWLFFAAFLFLLIGQTAGQLLESQSREMPFNAPLFLAESSVMMGLIALLFLPAIAGDAATRDVHTRIEPLLHAAPLRRVTYLGGHFAGAFAVGALLVLAVPLALIAGTLDAEITGPFRVTPYLHAYFFVVLPNVFVQTALMFAAATLMRHTLGSYLAAAAVFAGTLFCRGYIAGQLGRWELAQWLDPSAVTALGVMSKTWPPNELTERLVGLSGTLLGNRLLWLSIAFAALAFTNARFRFGAQAGTVRWWRRRRLAAQVEAEAPRVPLTRAALAAAPREFGAAARVRQLLTVTRDSLREIGSGWTWLLIPVVVLLAFLNQDRLQAQGVPILPMTRRVLDIFEGGLNFVFVFLVLFAGELVWRERDANMHALADTTPVPDWVRFAGKLLGLWIFVFALHTLLLLAGIATQISLGWFDFDLPLYLKVLFGIELVEPLVFALLALSVHVVANHKHVGHFFMLLMTIATLGILPSFGVEHPMLLYGVDPGWRYSAMSGFGPFLRPYFWFELYWAAWTLLVAMIARAFWVRGADTSFRQRFRIARRNFTGLTARVAAVAVLLILATGAFIFYNTNILNPYRSTATLAERQAEYERRYARYKTAPQPEITTTQLNIELYPDRREADVLGVYQLVNRTAQPIDTIHIAVSSDVETRAIEFGRKAKAELLDDDLGHRIYKLAEPLQPNATLPLTWQVRYDPRGFPAKDISTDVVANGTFIVMHDWAPLIGYQSRRELTDLGERKSHGLPKPADFLRPNDPKARTNRYGAERVELEVTIGTAADQTAIAPGELLRTWTRAGRRYFHYATAAPIGQGYAIFSAKYAVRRARAGDVLLEVVHHPEHTLNVERMLRGMKASVESFEPRFGVYRYKVLRMVEHPLPGGNLHAASGTIWYKELFSLFDTAHDRRKFDLAFAVVAHEVGHQFQTVPALAEGIGLLSESFAWYAAMDVVEKQYGAAHLQRLLTFWRTSYLTPRGRADVPLLRASDSFQSYRKGPFAMNALRAYVGKEKVDLAWRRLLDKHRDGQPPFATSLDLYRELRDVTPQSLHYLLADLFERNTFWDFKTPHATAQRMSNGQWQVTVEVTAKKEVVDENGKETNVPMNDLVEIGVFAPAQSGDALGEPLYLAMHRIRTGAQTITITVPQKPARAGIDPRHLLIDPVPENNLANVGEGKRRPQEPGSLSGPFRDWD